MTAASAFLPGLDGAAVAHCDGGPRGHPGAALGPTHSFSLFYLSPFVDPTAGERKARFCPVPLPPPPPACPCQPLLGSGALPLSALPGAVSQLSVPFPLPSPSAHPPLHPNPKRGDLQPPARRAGGEGAAGRPPRLSVLSAIPWAVVGTGPQPLPGHSPPALPCPARGFGTCWGQRGPLAAPPACGSGAVGTQGPLPYIHI